MQIAAAIRRFRSRCPPLGKRCWGHHLGESVAIVDGRESWCIGRLLTTTPPSHVRLLSDVVSRARDRANLEHTAEAVKGAGAKALVIGIDLGEPATAQAVVDKSLAAFGRIDALLNIAGAVPQIDLFEMTDVQWEAGLALKLHGARRLTIAAWPALKAAKGDRRPDVGQLGSLSESALRGRGHDRCRHCRAGEGVLGSRHRRWRAG